MKKRLIFIYLLALLSAGLFAQQKPVVAVAPFDVIGNAVTADQASEINDVFYVRLGNTRSVELVNRNIVTQVLKEHSFQADDWSNDKKTAEFAKALNANWIVQGNIRKSGNNLLIIIQFYDIKTFKFEGGTDIRLANADEAYDKMNPLVDSLIKTIADTGTRAPAATTPIPATKTYNVGDTGPAGGIIFYDRGFTGDGWRYLESAPAGSEFTAEWGYKDRETAYLHNIPNTMSSVGFGKRNTLIIVEELNKLNQINRAAQICINLEINGYKDWFLPSLDELNLMYKNLKTKGLGSFDSCAYWSSTQYTHNYDSKSERYQTYAYYINFTDGGISNGGKNNTAKVRAIRAF